jgi:LPXTG-site transpeptidase (sortase) family protein
VPSIGVDSKVVPLGVTIGKAGAAVWETAPFAVGFHLGSANPGEPGNVVLSGHISSPREGNVFNKLPNLKVGEGVIIVNAQQHYLYVVRDIQTVKPNAVEVLNPTANAIATLITCVPDGVYTHRLVVRCDAV